MKRSTSSIFFSFYTLLVSSIASKGLLLEFETHPYVLQVSPPKSGTHLLQKALYLISGEKVTSFDKIGFDQPERFQQTPEQFRKMITVLRHCSAHLVYDEGFDEIIREEDCLIVFSIRHPLDLLVSWAHYIRDDKYFPLTKGLSLAEIIDDLLDESRLSYHVTPHSAVYMPPVKGLKQAYEKYLPWMSAPNVLVVKFEDLVGPRGGGDLELQKQTIKEIADHLRVSLSQNDIESICTDLFGGTHTFRKGQIGLYKTELSPKQLKKGLQLMQPIIDQLDYDF